MLVGSSFVIAAALTIAAATASTARAQDAEQALAPTGKLRIGVYPGSPLSMVRDSATGETRGITVDLGRELARRLGVPFEHVVFQRTSDVLEGMKAGEVDFAVTNATPSRARDVAFSQTVLSVELGYLVPVASPIAAFSEVDRPGVRIGVTQSERTLPTLLSHAAVVTAPSLQDAIAMFGRGELDVFATNKPILFEMADEMPGARVLSDRWGVEHVGRRDTQGPRT